MIHLTRSFFLVSVLFLFGSRLVAVPPALESIEPSIGTVGTEFSVVATGSGFHRFKSILFYGDKVQLARHEVLSENELKLWFKSEPGTKPGRYYFRVLTTDGSSELRALTLTPYSILSEQRESQEAIQVLERSPETANVTILGVLEEGDRDRYKANFSKGERVSIEVEAVRLGYVLLDTVLTVYDPSGKILATVDDTPLYKQDPFITFVSEAGGEYTIEVRETAYEGDNRSRYALHIGNFARPAFVYPPGGPVGEKIDLTIEGDFASPPTLPTIPEANWNDHGLVLSEGTVASPTAIPFRASPFGNVLEQEPNDTPELPNANAANQAIAELPRAFNGILERPGDMDCFPFQGVEGKVYVFEAFADRVGSLADTVITILDQKGNVLVRNDDGNTHDSRLEFRAPLSDTYFLHVTDKLSNGDWRFIYRVEATERLPNLTAFLPRQIRRSQEGQTIQVPQGNRSLVKFGVQRTFFAGPVQGEMLNLPAGVKSSPITLEADMYWAPVVLAAEDSAEFGGKLINAQVTASADADAVRGGFAQTVDLIDGPADAIYHQANLDRLAVAVTRRVPFKVDLMPPTTSLPLDGSLELLVKVTRDPGFTGPVEVTIPVLPPDSYAEAKIEIPADQTEAKYTIHSLPVTPQRTWALCCEAQAGAKARAEGRGNGRRMRGNSAADGGGAEVEAKADDTPQAQEDTMQGADLAGVKVCSEIAKLTIAASPIHGTLQQTAGEQGTTIQVICRLDWKEDSQLPKELAITLEDLPNRVKADPVVWKGEKEIRIPLHFEETAPVGTFDSVYARMTGEIDGQKVSFNIGRGTKLVIAEPGKLMRNEAGDALSPLDTLRRRKQK